MTMGWLKKTASWGLGATKDKYMSLYGFNKKRRRMNIVRRVRSELVNAKCSGYRTYLSSASTSAWHSSLFNNVHNDKNGNLYCYATSQITIDELQRALTWGVRRGLLRSEKQRGGLRTYGLPHKEEY